MWAHAEYIKLLRSRRDGRVFDRIPEVAARYAGDRKATRPLEVWKPNRRPRKVAAGATLRIQAAEPFALRWSRDGWRSAVDQDSVPTPLGIDHLDLPTREGERGEFRFTFRWRGRDAWEGADYAVAIEPK
jgi:glucoamylase